MLCVCVCGRTTDETETEKEEKQIKQRRAVKRVYFKNNTKISIERQKRLGFESMNKKKRDEKQRNQHNKSVLFSRLRDKMNNEKK